MQFALQKVFPRSNFWQEEMPERSNAASRTHESTRDGRNDATRSAASLRPIGSSDRSAHSLRVFSLATAIERVLFDCDLKVDFGTVGAAGASARPKRLCVLDVFLSLRCPNGRFGRVDDHRI